MFGSDENENERRAVPTPRTWAAVAAGLVLLTAWLLGQQDTADAGTGTGANARPAAVHAAHRPLPGARPTRVDVPSVGIHARVVERGLDDAGAVDPPPYETPQLAGWYAAGPAPGEAGAALLVGHVDTATRPAVFYGLSSVKPGAVVEVRRTDDRIARFTVEAVEVVEKDRFSADRVYGQGTRPELRLITCGGTYDRAKRAYSANVVLYAALTSSRRA